MEREIFKTFNAKPKTLAGAIAEIDAELEKARANRDQSREETRETHLKAAETFKEALIDVEKLLARRGEEYRLLSEQIRGSDRTGDVLKRLDEVERRIDGLNANAGLEREVLEKLKARL